MEESYTMPFESIDDRDTLATAIMGISNVRVQQVLIARFGLNEGYSKTLQELSNEMGITRERVRQLELKGIRALRDDNAESLAGLFGVGENS